MKIHRETLDKTRGYFEQLRSSHPVKCGSFIDGKRVIETCYRRVGEYDEAVYRLEGEREHRVAQ